MRCDSQGAGSPVSDHGGEPCGLIVAQALQSFKLHEAPLQRCSPQTIADYAYLFEAANGATFTSAKKWNLPLIHEPYA
jgi:hypothetical protein